MCLNYTSFQSLLFFQCNPSSFHTVQLVFICLNNGSCIIFNLIFLHVVCFFTGIFYWKLLQTVAILLVTRYYQWRRFLFSLSGDLYPKTFILQCIKTNWPQFRLRITFFVIWQFSGWFYNKTDIDQACPLVSCVGYITQHTQAWQGFHCPLVHLISCLQPH